MTAPPPPPDSHASSHSSLHSSSAPPPAATQRWLADTWGFVASRLPPPPARVLDLGCGPHGGFVPMLSARGHRALGVDPEAPAGPGYRRGRFEDEGARAEFDAVVACTSLHHVGDLDAVADRIAEALVPDGVLVVIEWAMEAFDERTARWCFDRLPGAAGDDGGWLRAERDEWDASGLPWERLLQLRRSEEGMHTGAAVLDALGRRFTEHLRAPTPYFFADLNVPRAEEQAAIDAGMIAPTGIRWVGTPS